MVSNKRALTANADVALGVDGMVSGISRAAPTQGGECLPRCGKASEKNADGEQSKSAKPVIMKLLAEVLCPRLIVSS